MLQLNAMYNSVEEVEVGIEVMLNNFRDSSTNFRTKLIFDQVGPRITTELFNSLPQDVRSLLLEGKRLREESNLYNAKRPTVMDGIKILSGEFGVNNKITSILDFISSNENVDLDLLRAYIDASKRLKNVVKVENLNDAIDLVEATADIFNMTKSKDNQIYDKVFDIIMIISGGEYSIEGLYEYKPYKLDENEIEILNNNISEIRGTIDINVVDLDAEISMLETILNSRVETNTESTKSDNTLKVKNDTDSSICEVEVIEPHEELKIKEVDEREARIDKLNKFIGTSINKFISYLDKYEIYLDESKYKDLFGGTRISKKYSFEELEAVPSFRTYNNSIRKKKNK